MNKLALRGVLLFLFIAPNALQASPTANPPRPGSQQESKDRLSTCNKISNDEELQLMRADDALVSRLGADGALASIQNRILFVINNCKNQDSPLPAHLRSLRTMQARLGLYKGSRDTQFTLVSVLKKRPESKHEYGLELSALGKINAGLGNAYDAEQSYIDSVKILGETTTPSNQGDLAVVKLLLAELYANELRTKEAREAIQLAKRAIYEINKSAAHPLMAGALSIEGKILSQERQPRNAAAAYLGSISIQTSELGSLVGTPSSRGSSVANSLKSLAYIYLGLKDLDKALRAALDSFEIVTQVNGKTSPQYANSLALIGDIQKKKKEFHVALAMYFESLKIQVNAFGAAHEDTIQTMRRIAWAYDDLGDKPSAATWITNHNESLISYLLSVAPFFPAEKRVVIERITGSDWDLTYQLATELPDHVKSAYWARLNRNGIFLDIEKSQAALKSVPIEKASELEEYRFIVNKLSSYEISGKSREVLRRRAALLEKQLYKNLDQASRSTVKIKDVALSLPEDSVLIEFQVYYPWNAGKNKGISKNDPRYLAFVLSQSGNVDLVEVGSASEINRKVMQALKALGDNDSESANALSNVESSIIKPLLPVAGGARNWFISPDSELNRVPFAALTPFREGAIRLRLLAAGRDLVQLAQDRPRLGLNTLVVADPDFGAAKRGASVSSADSSFRQFNGMWPASAWERLPKTKDEGKRLAGILGAQVLTGRDATVSRIKTLDSPLILHIASHGYFLPDSAPGSNVDSDRGSDYDSSAMTRPSLDPLLRSGIVLAHANNAGSVGEEDDGILTAKEATGLSLDGTALVTLSACNTALGDIATGEGVYGLQRSMMVAGARSTLLSLWKVDDAATAEFMTRFYKRLKAGEGRSDALVATQKEFRTGMVRSPGGDDWSEPYYWAAWQLVGDWRPIPGL